MATHAIEIDRPIEDVFAVATDVTLTGRWYPADVEEWWVTPPPHDVGSVRRARVKVLGRATENNAVVTEYDPPRRAAMKGLSANAPFEATLAFEPAGDGTRSRSRRSSICGERCGSSARCSSEATSAVGIAASARSSG